MADEWLEWLELPEDPASEGVAPSVALDEPTGAQRAKTCPKCGWLDEETALECFRCGYVYNLDNELAQGLAALGLKLPRRKIEVEPVTVAALTRKPYSPRAVYDLRLLVERLALQNGFGQLLCLDHVSIDHHDYQIQAAISALRDKRGQALFADEVGLGKTIEAGLALKELLVRGLAKSVLILTPANLTDQWQEELEEKFGERFVVVRQPQDWKPDVDRYVISVDLAKTDRHEKAIWAREWDLLVVDEAHHLKNRSTKAHRLVSRIRKRYCFFLSATPVQNSLDELYSLITIIRPGQLGTIRRFKRDYVQRGDATAPRNADALRDLLGEVMIRNRRSTVNAKLPSRRAAVYHIAMSEAERELYDGLTAYIRQEYSNEPDKKHLRLALVTLQRELTSSPQAVASTLRHIAADERYPEATRTRMAEFLRQAEAIQRSRKCEGLLEICRLFNGKLLVFSEFDATIKHLVSELTAAGVKTVEFSGKVSREQKIAARRAFEGEAQVMVASRAAAEGLNLQHYCHAIVNFDLPWNPMRVEQRIGRVHRLGQQHPVTVFNFSTRGTIEEYIVEILARKIRMFELVVGELDLILGVIDQKRSFEELVTEAAMAESEQQMADGFTRLGERVVEARKDYERIKQVNDRLSGLVA